MKIDRSLVAGVPCDRRATEVVATALTLARELELAVVAEGVEERAQAQYLFEAGCNAIQGYLTARPMAVETWLGQDPVARGASPALDTSVPDTVTAQ